MEITEKEFISALTSKHGETLQRKLRAAKVAVCGLGGLGSNVATALVRAGVGALHLIDFDRVEITNLNRQQYFLDQVGELKAEALKDNLQRISPFTEYTAEAVKISPENIPELFVGDDIVCECFDSPSQKAMLVEGVRECFPDKFIVSASGMAGLDSANTIKTRTLGSRLILCGDGVSDVTERKILVGARVLVCAAHEAFAVISLINDKF